MTKFFKTPFADSGDKVVIPNAVQTSGDVSYGQGYGSAYQLPNDDPLKKDVERSKQNSLLNDITGAIGVLQRHGVPDWIAASDNDGAAFPYDKGSIVRYTDGFVYQSTISGNTATPGTSPNWSIDSGRLIAVRVFSTGAVPYTPTLGTVLCRARVQGAGGSGSGSAASPANTASAGGGGGSGAYAEGFYPVASLSGLMLTPGAGGIASAPAGNGNAGGASSIGSLIVAPGGGGATAQGPLAPPTINSSAAPGAMATGGNVVNATGQTGPYSLTVTGGIISGTGAPSIFGGGAAPVINTTAPGNAATTPGSGGSGAATSPLGSAQPGGAGANGLIIIEEYA